MTGHEPDSMHALDRQLKQTLRRNRQFRLAAMALTGLVAVLALSVLSFEVSRLSTENAQVTAGLKASCGFFRDLGALPVKPVPPLKKASLIGVTIVTDSRTAYMGIRCPNRLPPPDPSLVFWAHYYHLPPLH